MELKAYEAEQGANSTDARGNPFNGIERL